MTASLSIGAESDVRQNLALQGELYNLAGEIVVAAGASYKIGITSTKNLAFFFSRFKTAAAKARAYIYEGISYTGGTSGTLQPRNRARGSAAVSSVSLGVTATVANPIAFTLFGTSPGSSDTEDLLIFKKNTPYIVEIINDANSQSDAIFYGIICAELDL